MHVSITVLFWQKFQGALSANIYLFKVWIATLNRVWKVFKVNEKTLVRRKSFVVVHFVRFEQTLHLVWVLLWPFSKSKLMSSVVLAVFQYWYPHIFIVQPTASLQRTADFKWLTHFRYVKNIGTFFGSEANYSKRRITVVIGIDTPKHVSNESKMQNSYVVRCIKSVFSKLALLLRVWQKKKSETKKFTVQKKIHSLKLKLHNFKI